jgi:glycosyltransferase involved in cell wall biosynthesis
LNVLHIIATADPRSGGPIEGILRQTGALGPRASATLATIDPKDAPYLADVNLPVFAFGRPGKRYSGKFIPLKYGFSLKYIFWLWRNARNYDAVIVHGLWNFSTFAASITLPFQKSVRYFVYTHGMMDPWFRRQYPLKHLFKIASWLLCEGRLLRGARAVFFTADEELRLASNQFPNQRYNSVVVGYGTAQPPLSTMAQKEAFLAVAPELRGRRYLLFLSRIHPKKGCDLLVEAFAKIANVDPGLDLVVAGPDEAGLLPGLRERAGELGITHRIHWTGMVGGDAKWGAYHGAEAFILPSHQENFGVVVAEALACGLPVLTTYKVNIWREVEESGSGLAREDDLDGVVSLMTSWLGCSSQQREQMRTAALDLFHDQFDVSHVADRLVNFIEDESLAA